MNSIVALRELLAGGTVSVEHAVTESLRRIAEIREASNAFTVVLGDRALLRARELDAHWTSAHRGGLAGIPVVVKDAFCIQGVRTTAGSWSLQDNYPDHSALVVRILESTGAVIVAKTNMEEFGWGTSSFGRTNNPRDWTLPAGGSSGGSAAAVASGAVPLGIGSDAGGSVRVPAALCGIVGVKPTFGLLPVEPDIPTAPSLDHCGILGQSVEDVSVALREVLGGTGSTEQPPPRLGVVHSYVSLASSRVQHAFERTLDALSRAGVTLMDVEIPPTGAWLDQWLRIYAVELRMTASRLAQDRFSADTNWLLDFARTVSDQVYADAQAVRPRLQQELDERLAGLDALLTPTVGSSADDGDLDWEDYRDLRAIWNTGLFNLTGHPAVSIPLVGAPGVGVQLIGSLYADLSLLRTAAVVEGAMEPGIDAIRPSPASARSGR